MAHRTKRNAFKKRIAKARKLATPDYEYARKVLDKAKVPKGTEFTAYYGGTPLSFTKPETDAELKKWMQHVRDIISKVTYSKLDVSWDLYEQWPCWSIHAPYGPKNRVWIQLTNQVENQDPKSRDFKPNMPLGGTPVGIQHYADDRAIILAIYDTIEEMENHERDEFFQVNGYRVFNPHNDPFQNCSNDTERRYVRNHIWKWDPAVLGKGSPLAA